MLIRFRCDSDITFSRGLHKNLVTVLYFSIINVLWWAVEPQALPQANLVELGSNILYTRVIPHESGHLGRKEILVI